MSQFTLTQEEDALVLTALRDSAARYAAMFGVADPALEAVIAKVEGQLPQPEVEEPAPVATPVAEPEVAVETPQEEKPAKAKKAKAEEAAE
jgi:hypothetical protein